ncbi:MAG: hypothetical protein U1E19_14125 [Rhodoblastus sp.]
MKKTIFLPILFCLSLCPAMAQQRGAEPTMDGVARSASLMQTIGDVCPPLMDVNKALAERYAKAFVETGEQAYGKGKFAPAMAAERARRAAEVKAATPESWCIEQRDRLKPMGGAELFSK